MCRRCSIALVAACSALLLPAPSPAPVREKPPLATLESSGLLVAAVEIREVLDGGRVRCAVSEELQGSAREELEVELGEEAMGRLAAGGRWILAYRLPRGAAADRSPAVALALGDVGDALFEESVELRALLAIGQRSGAGADPSRELELLFALLERDQPRARRLALAELRLRADLLERLEREHLERLLGLLEREGIDEVALYNLLETLRPMSGRVDGERLAAVARRLLAGAGRDLDLASYWPALLVSAARTLGVEGGEGDAPVLAGHLRSNNSGVVRAALEALTGLAPAAARRAVGEALGSDELTAEARRILSRYQERR